MNILKNTRRLIPQSELSPVHVFADVNPIITPWQSEHIDLYRRRAHSGMLFRRHDIRDISDAESSRRKRFVDRFTFAFKLQ